MSDAVRLPLYLSPDQIAYAGGPVIGTKPFGFVPPPVSRPNVTKDVPKLALTFKPTPELVAELGRLPPLVFVLRFPLLFYCPRSQNSPVTRFFSCHCKGPTRFPFRLMKTT